MTLPPHPFKMNPCEICMLPNCPTDSHLQVFGLSKICGVVHGSNHYRKVVVGWLVSRDLRIKFLASLII